MDFEFSKDDELFRQEVANFVDKELPWNWREDKIDSEDPKDRPKVTEFKKKLAKKGWLTMAWPKEYGGQAAPHIRQLIFNEEMSYRGIPAVDAGITQVGPIIMLFGTDEQKKYFLPKISNAEIDWTQGYSEPDAGSDLAGLQTRAIEDGDDFLVTGSKIWNGAHSGANWMFMLVRTDPDAPKHRGISFLVAEMKSEGITVEPIPMMWDHSRALITLENVRVPKKNLIGELNRGWYVGAALLDFERSGIGYASNASKLIKELVQYTKETTRNGKLLSEDPIIRNELATMAVEIETAKMMAYSVAWMQSKSDIPNKEASISKAFGSEMVVRLVNIGMKILGSHGELEPNSKDAPLRGIIEQLYMSSPASATAAGSSEIQRNIIATRGLGLPRG